MKIINKSETEITLNIDIKTYCLSYSFERQLVQFRTTICRSVNKYSNAGWNYYTRDVTTAQT